MMTRGGFPKVLLRGEELVGGVTFSPSGNSFCFQKKGSLVWGSTGDCRTQSWLTLPAGESFTGNPAWIGEERVLFGVSGGDPKRDRLFFSPPLVSDSDENQQQPLRRIGPVFTAQEGGSLLSWDHSPAKGDGSVVVIHRLANAMLAEIVLVKVSGNHDGVFVHTVLAMDCWVEYSKPMAAFLANGALLIRLNALMVDNKPLRNTALLLEKLCRGTHHHQTKHGLWILNDVTSEGRLEPVHVMEAEHGTYDVCSNSYGRLGVTESFKFDPGRTKVVVSARPTNNGSGAENVSYSDEVYLLDFRKEPPLRSRIDTVRNNIKGCKIPVAVSETGIVYHFRSPTESGDLYLTNLNYDEKTIPTRLTETMPLSLKQKLVAPKEVVISNNNAPFREQDSPPLEIHALLFSPSNDDCDCPIQPLLWLHGGPMAQYSFDYNPLLSWLANCGYLVLAPNFSGSTGNGLDYMHRVLGEGCGVADLSDCLACAKWLRTLQEPGLDLSRGIAVAGHSWGGYLSYMCMLESNDDGESIFSCGIAAAGITDWFIQQRYTEVRYYDYALMGGWVYEKEVQARARAVSPVSKAKDLKAPLLVLHGDQDIDVPFQQIAPFVDAAKTSPHPNASIEYHAYPGEGHGMSGTSEVQADYLRRIQNFLRIHLKPWDFTSNPHGDLTAY